MFRINYKISFLFILYITTLVLIYNTPKEADYYYRADEGTYYRQAKAIKEHGITQIPVLVDAYIANKNFEQVAPHPLRLGHLCMAVLAITINDSISSLSYLSIFFYLIFVLIIYIYIKKWYGEVEAFIIGTLICFSPLLCGLSERALADVDYGFFQMASLLVFIDYLKQPSTKKYFWLLSSLSIALLFKEASLIFIPFYLIGFIYFQYKHINTSKTKAKIIGLVFIPIFISAITVLAIVGYEKSIEFLQHFVHALNTPDPYLTGYQSGPWYVYLIDLFLLSPYITLFALFFLGYYLMQSKKDTASNLLAIFLIYFLFCFILFPKDIRFGLPIDAIARIFAGLFLFRIYEKINLKLNQKKLLLIVVVTALSFIDFGSYFDFFVTNKIYDPSSYYLLKVKRIIP